MDTEINETTPSVRSRQAAAFLFDWVSAMIVAIMIPVILFTFFIRVVTVDGTSMDKTLHSEDCLILLTAVELYKYGDIVVIDRYVKEPLVKRIIGVAGDIVEITPTGEVYLNGNVLSEPYAVGKTYPNALTGQVRIPDGYVFVLGDNRPVSKDSRSADVGLVPVDDLVGKAVLRVWPFSSFGGIYDGLNVDGGDTDGLDE